MGSLSREELDRGLQQYNDIILFQVIKILLSQIVFKIHNSFVLDFEIEFPQIYGSLYRARGK